MRGRGRMFLCKGCKSTEDYFQENKKERKQSGLSMERIITLLGNGPRALEKI